jgi:hypothetical protein
MPSVVFVDVELPRGNVDVAVGMVIVPKAFAVGVRPTGRIGISAM